KRQGNYRRTGNPGNRGNWHPQQHPEFPAGVSEPRTPGRKAKWTPEVWKTALEALRVGTPRSAVYGLIGVCEGTWKSWMAKSDILREEAERAEAQAHISLTAPMFD